MSLSWLFSYSIFVIRAYYMFLWYTRTFSLLHGFFYTTMRGSQCYTRLLYRQKSFDFFKKRTGVLRHFLLHNFKETISLDQFHILCSSFLPNFSTLALHCFYLKWIISTCCKFSMFIKIMIKVLSVSAI